ncbi:hypothetical protein BH11MYX3_BH11MYX3_47420 [soil metagenome]
MSSAWKVVVVLVSMVAATPTAWADPEEPAPAADPWLDPQARTPSTTPAPPPIAEEPSAAEPSAPSGLREIQIHGFVSQGAFVSTANDYIGSSSRGSLEMFEAGFNLSTEVADRLRVGIQLFSRDVGKFHDVSPRVDWAFLDYRVRPWFGIRAGVIKMPFGLYNEYSDIDSSRTPLLLPQSIYPVRNREALLSHRGFSVYGTHPMGGAGELEYQAWLGSLSIPENALTIGGATLDSIDTKYVTGAQMFWHPPIEGLRIGGSWLRASIDFNLVLSPENTAAVIMAGLVPADYDGRLLVAQRPTTFVIGSAELIRGKWQLAAEYARSFKHQITEPALIPTLEEDREGLYASAAYQHTERLALGLYYSLDHLEASDRRGRDAMKYPERFYAYQRDLAASVRFDVNDHWLWKLEAHFMDGAAQLELDAASRPERFWGMFLVRTTVTF